VRTGITALQSIERSRNGRVLSTLWTPLRCSGAVSLVCTVLLFANSDAGRGAPKAAACGTCHGSAKSPPLPRTPLLAGQQAEFLVLQMFLFREGLRDVPQMKGLFKGWSDADLEAVAAYFASQPLPAAAGRRDAKLHARGAAISRRMGCGSCHLKDYSGQRQVPRLAKQREDYLAASMKAFRDNKRTGADTNMNAVMYNVSDGDIEALAHYFAHQ
jgi:cytochrome c553